MQILSGAFRPGDVLSGEVAASDGLGVSRSAYREAIRTLMSKGLVDVRPKAGTRVSDRANWRLLDPEVLAWLFASDAPPEVLSCVFELREIVEPRIAALAAVRRNERQLEQLRTALLQMDPRLEATAPARQSFHAVLGDASGNPFLRSLSRSAGAVAAWSAHSNRRLGRPERTLIAGYGAAYEAVAFADPYVAHAAMKALVGLEAEGVAEALGAAGS